MVIRMKKIHLLNDLENRIFEVIAEDLPPLEKSQLTYDLQHLTTVRRASAGEVINFEIEGYDRPPYKGQNPYSMEGSMLDEDGAELCIIPFKDQNGRLLELEIIRWEDGDMINPQIDTIRACLAPSYSGDGNSGDMA